MPEFITPLESEKNVITPLEFEKDVIDNIADDVMDFAEQPLLLTARVGAAWGIKIDDPAPAGPDFIDAMRVTQSTLVFISTRLDYYAGNKTPPGAGLASLFPPPERASAESFRRMHGIAYDKVPKEARALYHLGLCEQYALKGMLDAAASFGKKKRSQSNMIGALVACEMFRTHLDPQRDQLIRAAGPDFVLYDDVCFRPLRPLPRGKAFDPAELN